MLTESSSASAGASARSRPTGNRALAWAPAILLALLLMWPLSIVPAAYLHHWIYGDELTIVLGLPHGGVPVPRSHAVLNLAYAPVIRADAALTKAIRLGLLAEYCYFFGVGLAYTGNPESVSFPLQ